jgi:predicted amidohydrolase YtcJ
VRIGGVKLFVDGAFSDRTAWTEQPWPGSCDHGIRTATDEELLAALAWARRNRVQVAVHAMGDRALRAVVELLAAEQPWLDPLPSVRLEHATLLGPRLLDRLDAARMRFGVVSHSIFLYAESRSYVRNLPPHRLAEAYPIRSFYERVPAAALSSDNPATAWADADDVLLSVQAAVTRRAHDGTDFGRDQSVTVAQALLLYTGRARAVAPFEGVGVLEPGAEASFVVLDRDVLTVPEDEIARVRVDETWLRGQRAYQRCR